MLIGKRESMHGGGAGLRKGISAISQIRRASRLSESEHGPLVTDISLFGTPLLSKPHIGPCITPHYDLLEANMIYYEDMNHG